MIGRTPKGLSLAAVDEMGMGELTAPLLDKGFAARLKLKEEAYKAYIAEQLDVKNRLE